MTPDEIIYQPRVRVLEHAAETGNVAATCRTFGISRKTFYEWRNVAERYGLEALMPKARRRPQLPNATPTHVRARAVGHGGGRADAGLPPATPTGSLIAATSCPRRRCRSCWSTTASAAAHQRVARAAALAAVVHGLVDRAGRRRRRSGSATGPARPGDLVAVDSFYIGNLKGVGKRLPAHRHRHRHPLGDDPDRARPGHHRHTRRFIDHVQRRWRRLGWPVRAVLSDNGPEYSAPASAATSPPRTCATSRSRRAARTTTRYANASTAPPCRSAGGPRSTAAASPASASSKPKPTPGCTATTPPPQPRRLHARPHTPPSPRQPPQPPSSMTLTHKAHLSPRPPARKPSSAFLSDQAARWPGRERLRDRVERADGALLDVALRGPPAGRAPTDHKEKDREHRSPARAPGCHGGFLLPSKDGNGSDTVDRSTGSGAVWQRAAFGTQRSWVRVPSSPTSVMSRDIGDDVAGHRRQLVRLC